MGVIAKYKFNNTLADLLPEFNSEFTSDLYTITDEVDGEVTTRTIESDSLPTSMRFGRLWVEGESNIDSKTDSLLEVLDMNTSGLTDCHSMFRRCTNLTTITCEWDTSKATDMTNMFAYCNNLTSLDVSNWDTSNVIYMYAMFYSCTNLTSLDVSNFNTSKVTDMNSMFYNCSNLTTLDVSNFDTNNVTTMGNMFFNCNNITTLDVSNFNTAKVTNMNGVFFSCNKLTSLDVSNWNTSKVTNMVNMFNSCTNLTTLDVSNWDTSNVTAMDGIFSYCNKLTTLDVSNFDTSNVFNMYQMFRDCSSLVSLDVSRFDTSKVTTMYCMFYNCRNLTELDVSNWNTSNVESMYSMFSNCIRLLSLDISKWDTSKVTNIDYMFGGYNYDMNLVSLDINNFNIDNINKDYSHLFERMPYLKYLKCKNTNVLNVLLPYLPTKTSNTQGTIICKSDTTNLDTTTLQSKYWNILDEPTLIAKYVFDKSIHNNCIPVFNTEFEGYFIEDEVVEGSNEVTRVIESCGMLPTLMRFGTNIILDINYKQGNEVALISIEYLNTENLTSCNMMFKQCSNLVIVNTEGWDTSKVTDTYSMFYRCYNLTSLDLSNFDTSNVTTMQYMFGRCDSLTTLDVSNFDTTNVTNMNNMFSYCNNLTSLDVSNFNTSKVTDMTAMFSNTPLLADIGVLYMDKSSLQKLVNAMPTDSNKTLWYKDVDIDEITHGNNIILKKYKEENVEIVLNSPLLEGDTIEVIDGKLCHVHRYEKIVLDGNLTDTFYYVLDSGAGANTFPYYNILKSSVKHYQKPQGYLISDNLISLSSHRNIDKSIWLGVSYTCSLYVSECSTTYEYKQWLQANPITVIYELETPYYEDITPLQSSIALRTFEECNVQIITALPIKTKITYRTNITSAVVMEQELDTLDSGVSLSNLIEEEVNE